ncbi:Uncharacterized protein APZ42_011444 [Daphnia magna]|uniref:Uncharacterized protein n=1 Tax=Daphnia magna TaxID=35525 RepID=A0A162SNK5_9CRUS|nr:Uncharacterized protein APZ42_011444 [Daphnia magna]
MKIHDPPSLRIRQVRPEAVAGQFGHVSCFSAVSKYENGHAFLMCYRESTARSSRLANLVAWNRVDSRLRLPSQ